MACLFFPGSFAATGTLREHAAAWSPGGPGEAGFHALLGSPGPRATVWGLENPSKAQICALLDSSELLQALHGIVSHGGSSQVPMVTGLCTDAYRLQSLNFLYAYISTFVKYISLLSLFGVFKHFFRLVKKFPLPEQHFCLISHVVEHLAHFPTSHIPFCIFAELGFLSSKQLKDSVTLAYQYLICGK